jgi:hypothetical protein
MPRPAIRVVVSGDQQPVIDVVDMARLLLRFARHRTTQAARAETKSAEDAA